MEHEIDLNKICFILIFAATTTVEIKVFELLARNLHVVQARGGGVKLDFLAPGH